MTILQEGWGRIWQEEAGPWERISEEEESGPWERMSEEEEEGPWERNSDKPEKNASLKLRPGKCNFSSKEHVLMTLATK